MHVAGFKDVLAGPSPRRGGETAGEPPAKPPRHVTVLRFFFALLLLASAAGKLLDIRGFAAVVGTYQVLPETLLLPAALALSLVELALGLAFLWGIRLVAAALLTVLLHAGYVVWLGLAYLRGLHIANCGCFGVFWARPLTPWTFLEDGALLAAAAILYFGARRATCAGRSAKRSA